MIKVNMELIKKKYGQVVHDLLLEFPQRPEFCPRDIASLSGLSPQHIRNLLVRLHGTSRQPRLKTACKLINVQKFGLHLQKVLEAMKCRKISCNIFMNLDSGKTFAVRRLCITKRGKYRYYTCFLRTQVDYVVGIVDGRRYFVFPLLKKACGLVYNQISFVEWFENAFHSLTTHSGGGDYEDASNNNGQ